MGFTREQLEAYRAATLPDLLGPGLRLLFVGINPGLWTAAVQAHFARPGNRFYPALLNAGIIGHRIDASKGMRPADRDHLIARGIGITNLVSWASAKASELPAADLRAGAERLRGLVDRRAPRVVAVCGITGYRAAFDRPKAVVGAQTETMGRARIWVVPNPSGLNAHETVASLASAYGRATDAAGLRRVGRPGGVEN